MIEKTERAMENIKGEIIAILGFAFKAETDGVRGNPY